MPKPSRQSSVRPSTVPVVARFYPLQPYFAGLGNRWNHRNLHVDPCGDAAVAAGFRSRQALPHRRRRRLLRRGGPQDKWGMFSFALYERLKGRKHRNLKRWRPFRPGAGGWACGVKESNRPPGPCDREYVTGNYFSTLGVGAFGDACSRPMTTSPRLPGRRAQPPRLADNLCQRSIGRRLHLYARGSSLFCDWSCAPRIFRRNAAKRPSRYLAPPATGTP